MITILLEQIIQLLTGWIEKFNNHAEAVENSLDTLNDTAADIETNTDPIPEIRDNTGAVITPINNIKTNTDTIAANTTTTASNTTVIKNNIGTIATNTGSAAAFAEDCANNTLDIKDKVTTIASDTTQIRADHVELENDLDKIYEAIKWSLIDKYIEITVSGSTPISFETDISEDLKLCKTEINATQSGSGDPTPTNVRTINGYTDVDFTVNGNVITISLGQTVYNGYLDAVTGNLIITSGYVANMGAYNYQYLSSYDCFRTTNFSLPYKITSYDVVANSMCDSYTNDTVQHVVNRIGNYTYGFGTTGLYSGHILFRNTNYTDASLFKASMNNVTLVYELATPIEVSLTPTTISYIKGNNTISNNINGNMEITYEESIKYYLDNQ